MTAFLQAIVAQFERFQQFFTGMTGSLKTGRGYPFTAPMVMPLMK